jgi:ribosomal protein L11 methylase PrmA
MRWIEHRYLLRDDAVLDAALEALAAIDCTAFAASTRPEGGHDLVVYGENAPPLAAREALAGLGILAESERDLDEQVLYRALHPEAAIEIADGVWVAPRLDAATPDGALRLVLPIGPAWGDGHHPTTRLCASRLSEVRVRGQRVLDLGCGSGLLGVLAAKRGAASVDLADLDPHSLRVAGACLTANSVSGRIFQGDLLAALPAAAVYDVVVANLWADLVLALLADARFDAVLPHGRLVLSGVNVQRRDEVRAALAATRFTLHWQAEEAWWWAAEVSR